MDFKCFRQKVAVCPRMFPGDRPEQKNGVVQPIESSVEVALTQVGQSGPSDQFKAGRLEHVPYEAVHLKLIVKNCKLEIIRSKIC
jgi:hypothetical protein